MSCVLVTGGAGYVGSHACKALARAGHQPVVYDNLSRGHRSAVRYGPLEVGDLLDRERLDAVLETHRPQAVLHFAGLTYVGESVQQPARYYRHNVGGTLTLLEALHAQGIRRLIFSSSCAVYGMPQHETLAESHAMNPVNPYGWTKLMAERMLADCAQAHGLSVMALRYFNAAGADPEGEIGEAHEPETHLIPLALAAALPGGAQLSIHGNDYPTPDGTCIRDYVHVSDLAHAHVLALQQLTEDSGFQACNLGYGHGHSVNEVIATVEAVTGRRIAQGIGPRRAGDPPCLVADNARALAMLRWQPRHTGLHDIVASAWQWHRRPAAESTL